MNDTYDYIVVGAGSAGSVLAARLSEDPSRRVLLIEAGPEDRSLLISMPKGFGALVHDPQHSWQYETEAVEGNGFRREKWARGRMLGGSSSINGMTWVRGQQQDFDGWEQSLGLQGWGWTQMGPAFRALEDHEMGDDGVRGVGGPVRITRHPDRHPVSDAVIAAAGCLGIPQHDDQNRPDQFGVGYMCRNIKHGRRQSAALTFLKPARSRANLRVITDTRVHGVLFDQQRAVGVDCADFKDGGHPRRFSAAREVILCGGTLQSPQILQLSGIGPAALLQSHGIAVVADLPGVGENLREHWCAWMNYRLSRPLSYNFEFSGWRLLKNVLRYLLTHKGLMAAGAAEINGFLKSRPDLDRPDLQIHAAPYSLDMSSWDSKTTFDRFHGANVLVYPTRPESRGSVMIRSADPALTPMIRPNYLATANDRRTAIDAIRLIRRLAEQPPLQPYIAAETFPGPRVQSDADIIASLRRSGQSGYHATGTCRMGSADDPQAVVDTRLRVRGVSGLRVVDCSVMPTTISGNTNAPAMAMAWRAADLIREDADRR